MGDMADLLEQQMMRDYFNAKYEEDIKEQQAIKAQARMRRQYQNKELEWTTKDKKKVLVQDMGSTHLLNTYRMIKRQMESNVERPEWHCIIATAWLDVLHWEIDNRNLTILT